MTGIARRAAKKARIEAARRKASSKKTLPAVRKKKAAAAPAVIEASVEKSNPSSLPASAPLEQTAGREVQSGVMSENSSHAPAPAEAAQTAQSGTEALAHEAQGAQKARASEPSIEAQIAAGKAIAANAGRDEMQLVVFRLGKEEFGVDITQVREIIKLTTITRVPNAPEFIEGVINLRGQITAVMDLRKRLGIEANANNGDTRIIVVELPGTTLGMIVDNVSEVLRLGAKDIDAASAITSEVGSEYIRGIGKLKDRLLILLDLSRVLART